MAKATATRKKRVDQPHKTPAPAAAVPVEVRSIADETLAIDVAEMLLTREKATNLYKEAARQEETLIARMELSGVKILTLANGTAATLVNNFANSTVAWKSAKVQAKEIKVVS